MTLESKPLCIRINAPELKHHKKFIKWLHKRSTQSPRVATWHCPSNPKIPSPPAEYSDIFVWADHGEGSDTDMPEDVWQEVLQIIGKDYFGIVWITFLEY